MNYVIEGVGDVRENSITKWYIGLHWSADRGNNCKLHSEGKLKLSSTGMESFICWLSSVFTDGSRILWDKIFNR